MAFFDKEKLTTISQAGEADLTKASLNLDFSSVKYETDYKFFYVTIDKVLFSNPVKTVSTVLEAHGYVANLENILSCLDSFVFSIRAKTSDNSAPDASTLRVSEYLPCIGFKLPEKDRVGPILQSFYNEISKYQSQKSGPEILQKGQVSDAQSTKKMEVEINRLKTENENLTQKVDALMEQLMAQRDVIKVTDSKESLPANTKMCRVEHVDLKQRIVKVKSLRKLFDIPTHMLDRVPEFKSRCLITFDEQEKVPLGVLFFDNTELESLEKRTADLLYVKGDSFKARDSMRNEFQIKAVNPKEQKTIQSLRRGMKILVSIVDGYIVRFSVLTATEADTYKKALQEQLVVFDIGRNQLVNTEARDSTAPVGDTPGDGEPDEVIDLGGSLNSLDGEQPS